MESLLELFVTVDDFCKAFLPILEQQLKMRNTLRAI